MSSKVAKAGGAVNSKLLMTKWDANSVDRLTRADFYNDHFQPREAFLIPNGMTYPNERTMLKAMNEIQRGLKNGGDKEWKIIQLKRGSRVVRLEGATVDTAKDRSPSPNPEHNHENVQAKRVRNDNLERKHSTTSLSPTKTEAKTSDSSTPAKKAPRSIFTVHERRNDLQGQTQEAVADEAATPTGVEVKQMENRDLEMAIHGLEDFEQYTHDQLQKILDVNKRFFQLNQHGHKSKLSSKQIKDVLNAQEAPKRNKSSSYLESQLNINENNSYENENDAPGEQFEKEDARSEMDRKKNRVSKKTNKKAESSDDFSDEKYVFAGYHEKSESSLFDTDSDDGDNENREPKTMVTSKHIDKMADENLPRIHRSRKTLTKTGGTGDQVDIPGTKHKKRSTGDLISKEVQCDEEQKMNCDATDTILMSDSKLKKIISRGGGEIEEGGGENVGFDSNATLMSKEDIPGKKKSVSMKERRLVDQGDASCDRRSVPYSRLTNKTLRRESLPSTSIGSSHAVNQRKKNVEIDRENNRLSAKLELIKLTPPKNSITFRTSRQEQLPFARIQRRLSKKSI